MKGTMIIGRESRNQPRFPKIGMGKGLYGGFFVIRTKLLNLENHVKTGKMKNILDVAVHVDEFQTIPRLAEPLLGREKNAQSGAGDIIKFLKIHHDRFGDLVQYLQGFFCLGRIQSARKDNITVLIHTNVEHSYSRGSRNEIVLIRF